VTGNAEIARKLHEAKQLKGLQASPSHKARGSNPTNIAATPSPKSATTKGDSLNQAMPTKQKIVRVEKGEYTRLVKDSKLVKTLKQKLAEEKMEHKKLQDDYADLEAEFLELQEEYNQLKSASGKKITGRKKSEAKKDIIDAIHHHVREITFRTVKFAQPGKEIAAKTKDIWHQIKDKQNLNNPSSGLNEHKFVEIYAPVVQSELSLARQYVQTRGQNAARRK
jgi:hypothetical protein